MNFLKLDQLR